MSEYADMALSETMDMEDLRFSYRQGRMSDQRAFDEGIIDHRGGYRHVPMFSNANKSKTCRYCGKTGLKWKHTDDGWRLAEKDEVHSCKEYRPSSI